MTSELDSSITRRLGQFVSFCSVLSFAFGLWVLAGWMLHIQIVKSILPRQVAVKANTAACFILIGFALWVLGKEQLQRAAGWKLGAKIAAVAASVVGLLSLLEFLFGWDLGIDQLLFTAGAEDIPGSVRPGLMSPLSALSFSCFGPALLMLDAKTRIGRWLAQLAPISVTVAVMFGILDFVLDPGTTHTHISPVTALVLFLLAFALMFSRTQRGLGSMVASPTLGGTLTRRLVPAAVLIPLLVSWLRWKGQSTGLYSEWTDVALMTVISVALLVGLTAWTAVLIDRSDLERRRGGETISRLASIVNFSNDAIIGTTTDGIITSWNPGAELTYGYSAQEMIGKSISIVIAPGRCEEFTEIMEKIRLGQRVSHYETEPVRKDGERVFVSLSVSPVKDQSGHLAGISTIARDVTERKRAEEELHQASLYARNLIEASLDPLVTISKDGKIMDVNRATELATGVERNQLIGSDFCDYFTEPGKARHGYEQVFAEETVQDYPLAIRHASGRVIDVLYNASVFRNSAGGAEGVFAAARDITKRKQAEEQLRRVSLYTRSLIEASLDPLVTISKDGKITDVNEASIKATGIPRERLIGSDFSNYFTEPEKAREGYQRVFKESLVRDYPLAIRHTTGTAMEVLYNATVFRNAAGEIDGVFAAARDITERKRAQEALQHSETRYRSLVTATAQIVWTTNPDGEVMDDIPMWRTFAGMSRDELKGWGWIESLHPDDREHTAEVWRKAVHDRSLYDIEYRIRRHDGEYRNMAVRGVPVLEGDSDIREWVGTCTDITERKQAEEEVRRLNEELEQRVVQRTAQLEAANKELEAFTYSVSHDLRAPLRHISGFSKMLTEEFGPNLPAEAQHHLQRIQEGTRRMGLLVDDLLNLGRIGRHEVRLQVTGLNSIVNEVVDELKPEWAGRKVGWKIDNLPFVECDPALIKQVFQNLLSNAIKFTRPRGQAVIEVGQKNQDGTAVVFVRDNGVGFNMKYSDKLFGVFQRLHRPEDFEGTGVGLATVQRIIQKHGGSIWAEAELDKGATFYFTLGTSETESKTKAAMAGETA